MAAGGGVSGSAMNAITDKTASETGSCPIGAACPATTAVGADDVLALPMQKRMVVQRSTDQSGAPELRLYYGAKEISFDEPELFAFAETLAKQSLFRAGAATSWGNGYAWTKVRDLLEQLIAEGVLEHADEHALSESPAANRARPSLLPPALSTTPRTWLECEAITAELTGRPVEMGYLELIVPIFRVAHIALDADGRQVGEANVFPRALRLDVPTDWLTCIYPGTRYLADRPMNLTALKGMRAHWNQMMAALHRIRSAYLRRFPSAADGWTVGHLERLSVFVLAVPTYQLMRCDRPVANGELHPALSSLFRVTDGLRMTIHQMLFVPFGEPTLSPHDPMTSERILQYAERNYSFHSTTGVCAGPKNMVQEFLNVVVDGYKADEYASFVFDPPVEAALDDIEAACDYGLYGLQAYAATFSLWPLMTRTYERLAEIAEEAVRDGAEGFTGFRDRMRGHLANLKMSPFLAMESWRVDREKVYADMYEQCGRGVAAHGATMSLPEQIAPVRLADHSSVESKLMGILKDRFQRSESSKGHVEEMLACLMDYLVRTQAILRLAGATQGHINRLLGRADPTRPFGSADIDVHNLLQGSDSLMLLPYLLDELEQALGVGFAIDAHRIVLTERHAEAVASS
jgi:hypothetical protein